MTATSHPKRHQSLPDLLLLALSCAILAATPQAWARSWGDVTFFVGSDLHYGYTNGAFSATDASRSTLASMIALPGQSYPAAAGRGAVDNPRGVLLIGDLTELGTADQWNTFTNDWGLKGERLLPWPVYEGYGNHDCMFWPFVPNGIKARNTLRPGVTNISANGYHYSWDWDNVHMVCLNLFPGDTGDIYGYDPHGSLTFLVDDLAKYGATGRPIIIYHHYGLDPAFGLTFWTSQQQAAYLAAISGYNVIAILTGHNHLVDCIPWNGVNTFNDGTAGKPMDSGEPLGYLVVHLTQTNLVVAERRTGGTWGSVFSFPISLSYAPHIVSNPGATTAVVGSATTLTVRAAGTNLTYQWFWNGTNAVAGASNSVLCLSEVALSEAGSYSVLVSNNFGSAVSQPAALTVSAPVAVRAALGILLSGSPSHAFDLEYSDTLFPAPVWRPLATVTMTNTSQVFVDAPTPAAPQRFYRGASSPAPLKLFQVPVVTVFGNAGDVLQLQYSDTPDPGAPWVPLATLTLTSSSNLFQDTSAPSLSRCYRAVASP